MDSRSNRSSSDSIRRRLLDGNAFDASSGDPVPGRGDYALARAGAALREQDPAPRNRATEPVSGPARETSFITARDGVQLYYKDWGAGQPIVFSHGWPLNSDSWEGQMLFLASRGYRCVAHDRRGHGRSTQSWNGNEMNTYADDLASVMETLDLQKAILVGFSTGGGEVTRYIGRHGTKRVAGVALVAAVPPLMLRTATNPGGLPMEVFDRLRAGERANRAQLYRDVASGPFFGFNRPGARISQGLIDAFCAQCMQAGHKSTYDCIKAFSESDFNDDLRKFDVPTLFVHGSDDQIVPIDAAARAASQKVRNSRLVVYAGAPHGITHTHKDSLNIDLLDFARSVAQ